MPSAATTGDTVATTRFSGRAFSVRELALIRDVVRECSGLSRMELARTVCELLRWRRPNGRLKARECREFLERLDAEGALVLPDKRARSRGWVGDPRSADGGVRAGAPAGWQCARCRAAEVRVGVRACPAAAVPGVGGPLPLSGAQGSVRGPLALSGVCVAARACGGRLPAVFESGVAHGGAGPLGRLGRVGSGAESAARGQQQPLLLLPWVTVKNLASAVLSRGLGQLRVDWPRRYHLEPWLVETLVDARRHHGGCYRAANFVALGATSGRGRMDRHRRRVGAAPRTVLVYPLVPDAQRRLRER